MSTATVSARAAAFFREAQAKRQVWTVRDDAGYPVPATGEGHRAMPFWSTGSRVAKVVATVAGYETFEVVALPLEDFRSSWLPGLERDGLLVGLNWSAGDITDYDVAPRVVEAHLAE